MDPRQQTASAFSIAAFSIFFILAAIILFLPFTVLAQEIYSEPVFEPIDTINLSGEELTELHSDPYQFPSQEDYYTIDPYLDHQVTDPYDFEQAQDIDQELDTNFDSDVYIYTYNDPYFYETLYEEPTFEELHLLEQYHHYLEELRSQPRSTFSSEYDYLLRTCEGHIEEYTVSSDRFCAMALDMAPAELTVDEFAVFVNDTWGNFNTPVCVEDPSLDGPITLGPGGEEENDTNSNTEEVPDPKTTTCKNGTLCPADKWKEIDPNGAGEPGGIPSCAGTVGASAKGGKKGAAEAKKNAVARCNACVAAVAKKACDAYCDKESNKCPKPCVFNTDEPLQTDPPPADSDDAWSEDSPTNSEGEQKPLGWACVPQPNMPGSRTSRQEGKKMDKEMADMDKATGSGPQPGESGGEKTDKNGDAREGTSETRGNRTYDRVTPSFAAVPSEGEDPVAYNEPEEGEEPEPASGSDMSDSNLDGGQDAEEGDPETGAGAQEAEEADLKVLCKCKCPS